MRQRSPRLDRRSSRRWPIAPVARRQHVASRCHVHRCTVAVPIHSWPNQATMRRVTHEVTMTAALKARLGYAIFVRTPDGAVATAEGEELLEAARAVEQAMDAANRRFGALDDTVEGTVRLATNLPLAELLLPRLGHLRDTAPMLTLELLINQRSSVSIGAVSRR